MEHSKEFKFHTSRVNKEKGRNYKIYSLLGKLIMSCKNSQKAQTKISFPSDSNWNSNSYALLKILKRI